MLRKFIANTQGATAIEYGLIVALISIAIISAAAALSGSIGGMLTLVVNELV